MTGQEADPSDFGYVCRRSTGCNGGPPKPDAGRKASRSPLQARQLISAWRDVIDRAEQNIAEIEQEFRDRGLCIEGDLHEWKGNGCRLCGYDGHLGRTDA